LPTRNDSSGLSGDWRHTSLSRHQRRHLLPPGLPTHTIETFCPPEDQLFISTSAWPTGSYVALPTKWFIIERVATSNGFHAGRLTIRGPHVQTKRSNKSAIVDRNFAPVPPPGEFDVVVYFGTLARLWRHDVIHKTGSCLHKISHCRQK